MMVITRGASVIWSYCSARAGIAGHACGPAVMLSVRFAGTVVGVAFELVALMVSRCPGEAVAAVGVPETVQTNVRVAGLPVVVVSQGVITRRPAGNGVVAASSQVKFCKRVLPLQAKLPL